MKNDKINQVNLFAKECMATALIQLLKEKPLSCITVSEITKKAGVSRMTYYRNYEKKEDILIAHLSDIITEYRNESMPKLSQSKFYDIDNLLRCFSYFQKHDDFIHSLFQCGLGNYFLSTLTQYILNTWHHEGDSVEQYIRLQAFAGTLYNIYLTYHDIDISHTQIAFILSNLYQTNN